MDISKLNLTEHANRGAELQILHPVNKTPLDGMTITLRGADSTLYRQRLAEWRRKFLNTNKVPGVSDAEEQAMECRVACTVKWKGMELNGKPYECTPENVRELYSNPGYSWIVEQVDAFIQERSNFFVIADGS